MRYFMQLSYDGTKYHGWQKQPKVVTIQETIEQKMSTMLRSPIEIMGSGRTDAGVHASCQIVHFDHEAPLDTEDCCYKLNSFLPNDIAVRWIRKVDASANARFSAQSRAYVYKVHFHKDPFLHNKSYLFRKKFNLDLMNQCCDLLKLHTDFECFSRVRTDVKTFNCGIDHAEWILEEDYLFFRIRANRFLRGMVRAVVGTTLLVGEEKLSLSGFQSILESKDRKKAGDSAPACGLYLSEVNYPQEIYI